MANPIGEPHEVDNLARLYRREADRIEETSASAVQALADVEWVGRRATDTRERVRARHNDISAQVAELRSMARSLESHAQWMRSTIRELESLEARIRTWAAAHPPGSGVGPDASLIGTYPSYCSFALAFPGFPATGGRRRLLEIRRRELCLVATRSGRANLHRLQPDGGIACGGRQRSRHLPGGGEPGPFVAVRPGRAALV